MTPPLVPACLTMLVLAVIAAGRSPLDARRAEHSHRVPQPQALASPRTTAQVTLRPLWRSAPDELLYPIDIQFSAAGLLVFDQGAHGLHALDSRTGRILRSFGRQGTGPGEYTQPAQLFGTRREPHTVQFSIGRVADVSSLAVTPRRTPSGGRWSSACSWRDRSVLLQTAGHATHDVFIVALGDSARLLDSIPVPFPRLSGRPFMERQAQLRQVDDSTCAIVPLYQPEFALLSPGRPTRSGSSVEVLPEARLQVIKTEGGRIERLQSGARAGAIDVRGWRDLVLVLFSGTTHHKRRVIDAYSRSNLGYVGSILLPLESTRMAISGDTLAVVGDDQGVPAVAAFLLSRTRNGRPRARKAPGG
ncbi:MAG: hypothetical protein IT361_18510 [Gemmatimonadaceae bacterium]|nr:hypothetical protein [Gemmatimonadaceae bacterium]